MQRRLKVLSFLQDGNKNFYDYQEIWRLQKYFMKGLIENRQKKKILDEDYLILVEHSPVYTLGRGATPNNFKIPMESIDIPIYHVERGGDVTWHGPGQLVTYPIFDLNEHKRDLHWFVRSMEETVIRTLNHHYQIEGVRSSVNSGVWVNGNKISAVGITASRWITMHGIAININCDMKYFNEIIPCGIPAEKGGVCRVIDFTSSSTKQNDLVNLYLQSLSDVFKFREIERSSFPEVKDLLEKSQYAIPDTLQKYHV